MIKTIKKIVPKKIRSELKLFLNRGDKYLCPFCHYQAKELSMIGLSVPVLKEKEVIGAGRRMGGCFKCGSSDRERLTYIYLEKVYNLPSRNKDIKILHFAPSKHLSDALLKLNIKNYI